MVKLGVGFDQILAAGSEPGTRVYSTPFAPGKIVIGGLAFGRGEVPAPLRSYAGQTGKVAHACTGRRGYAFVACLRNEAKEMGVTKHAG